MRKKSVQPFTILLTIVAVLIITVALFALVIPAFSVTAYQDVSVDPCDPNLNQNYFHGIYACPSASTNSTFIGNQYSFQPLCFVCTNNSTDNFVNGTITPDQLSAANSNPYWNSHSQSVANWVIKNTWNPQVQMLATDPGKGCTDTLGGVTVKCSNSFWTTSDNDPTCWALADFNYQSQSAACINKMFSILSFTTTLPLPAQRQSAWMSGWRYEAYYGIAIPIGSPGDGHRIVQVGTLQNGQLYAIKSDSGTGSIGSPGYQCNNNKCVSIDVVAPQAINYYLRGDMADAKTYANALVSRWDGYGVGQGSGTPPGWYNTYQLGQVMFVMRVMKMDNTATFRAMKAQLFCLQAADGHLPNQYNRSCQGSGGQDVENQDTALLPFCYDCVALIQNSFGKYSLSSSPP